MITEIFLRIVKGRGPYGVDSVFPHAFYQHSAVQVARILFPCSADIRHQRIIRFPGACKVLVKKRSHAAERVRLHYRPKLAFAALSRNGECVAHFCRIMSVIMEYLNAVDGVRKLEATVSPGKAL